MLNVNPIPTIFVLIPIPFLFSSTFSFPFPWESQKTHGIPVISIPMHTSSAMWALVYVTATQWSAGVLDAAACPADCRCASTSAHHGDDVRHATVVSGCRRMHSWHDSEFDGVRLMREEYVNDVLVSSSRSRHTAGVLQTSMTATVVSHCFRSSAPTVCNDILSEVIDNSTGRIQLKAGSSKSLICSMRLWEAPLIFLAVRRSVSLAFRCRCVCVCVCVCVCL